MIKLENMLMIGSTGRNAGKTTLAETLIEKFSRETEVVGLKVTTIKERGSECPRGGKGCGVCSSLEGEFCITEETKTGEKKDTEKLLAAGAKTVFWLRVLKQSLVAGTEALLKVIPSGAAVICESNSLRQAVEPGLFLMMQDRNAKEWKSSAREIRRFVDAVVAVDCNGKANFNVNEIAFVDGRWTMPVKATAIIMAGGGSRRMGKDKSMLPVNGLPIIERICNTLREIFSQILISSDEKDKYSFLGLDVVPDKTPGEGPLIGIASTMEASRNELNFVTACDIPNMDTALIRKLLKEAKGYDAVVPVVEKNQYEPLFAVYRKSAIEAMNDVLSSGRRKISDVFSRCRVKYVELGDDERPQNLNTPSEYEEFLRKTHG